VQVETERAVSTSKTFVQQTLDEMNGCATKRPRLANLSVRVGSGGRIRTYDQAVNSRPLYH